MPRKQTDDPKVTVGLSLRQSTVDYLESLLPESEAKSVGLYLSNAVEAKFGIGGTARTKNLAVRDGAGRTVGVRRVDRENFGARLKGAKK